MNEGILHPTPGPITFKSEDLRTHFAQNLRSMDYVIVDFDGTIYPRLFVFDVTKKIFEQHSNEEKYRRKLEELLDVAQTYADGDFKGAYAQFLKLLEGENSEEFQRNAKQMMIDSYKYAKLTIDTLKQKYGLRVYLISLTADFIGNAAQKYFGFQRAFSVGYITQTVDNIQRFTGKTSEPIDDPQVMKRKMLSELGQLESRNNGFICFFDSVDDLPVAEAATLKVGVNPKLTLLANVDFDVVLRNKESDPWKEFYSSI